MIIWDWVILGVAAFLITLVRFVPNETVAAVLTAVLLTLFLLGVTSIGLGRAY